MIQRFPKTSLAMGPPNPDVRRLKLGMILNLAILHEAGLQGSARSCCAVTVLEKKLMLQGGRI